MYNSCVKMTSHDRDVYTVPTNIMDVVDWKPCHKVCGLYKIVYSTKQFNIQRLSTFSPNTPVTSRFFMDVGTNTLSAALCLCGENNDQ